MEHVTAAEPDLQQPTDDAPALPGLDHVPGGPTLEDRPSAVRLTKHSWTFVVRATVREFLDDDCLDNAAALTFYAVLAAFPGLVALTSLVGVLGQGGETVDVILGVLRDVGAGGVADTVEPYLTNVSVSPNASTAFVVGLLAALWSASGYVNSFSRAMNRILEVEEGRPIWKLRPAMVLLTVVLVVLAAAVVISLVVTGPAAESLGSAIGLEDTTVVLWNVAKWPVILLVVVTIVGLLYRFTPNVKRPKFRWLSLGAVLAILVWVAASVGFGFYVATLGDYDATYGSLASAVVLLLWLSLTNVALLLGAELDSELERGRQLQAGLPAEERLQFPPRDTRNVEKARERREKALAHAETLRRTRGAAR